MPHGKIRRERSVLRAYVRVSPLRSHLLGIDARISENNKAQTGKDADHEEKEKAYPRHGRNRAQDTCKELTTMSKLFEKEQRAQGPHESRVVRRCTRNGEKEIQQRKDEDDQFDSIPHLGFERLEGAYHSHRHRNV